MRILNIIANFDLAFSIFFSKKYSSLVPIAKIISHTGNGPFYVFIALIASLISNNGEKFVIIGLASFAIELPIYWLTKNTFRRQRPSDSSSLIHSHITPPDKYSLPSGHAAAAFVMSTLIGYFHPSLLILSLCWATAIAISRVLLGVHFLTDIVLGAALGVASTNLIIKLNPFVA
ncbi:phosphatase PAP2 family protein [Vibrio sp. L5-1]|uniref:phosphatase PAP2 family protein n=1 Tax=Vibrio sp. L5-1 TaxID=2912254 RepID=UPI001F37D87A|nr:phosphatase PAP2 family protein [Vibrio sp. L5-1]MCF7495741.1 phosphatase PAP2 family protein [Vibrio sp. L5-1]